MSDQQRVFVVSLVPAPGCDPIRALRALLKLALRRFKLRCIEVQERDVDVADVADVGWVP